MSIEKHFADIPTSFCQNSGDSVSLITVLMQIIREIRLAASSIVITFQTYGAW